MAQPALPPTPRRRGSGPLAWVLAGVAFVIGIALGAVVTALLGESPQSVPAAAPSTVTVPVATGAAPNTQGTDVTAQITINQACVQVINTAQDAFQAISELGEAAKQFDIGRLDEIVRRLQPIQSDLQRDIAACNISTKVSPSALSAVPTTR